MNLHSSYKVSDHLELFGLIKNLFDRHYYVYGTFFDVTSFPYLNLTDPAHIRARNAVCCLCRLACDALDGNAVRFGCVSKALY